MYTIMIVDDNDTELLVAKKALEKQYSIIDINNPKTALQRLAKSTIMPDFILLDVAMPGINGFDFIMRLKTSEKTKNIPVLFLSGDKENTTEMEAYRLGGVDFIRKPIIPD
ncbi:MAG: response regulator, partial [Lachnospiraceae bacterium]|nr:response regulator [Lachnospiraceae bacterium]